MIENPKSLTEQMLNLVDRLATEMKALFATIDTKQDKGDYATSAMLSDGLAGKANTSHTHSISQVTDFNDSEYVKHILEIPSNGSTGTSIQVTGMDGSDPVLTSMATQVSDWEPLLTFLSRKGNSEYTQIVMGHDDITFSIGPSKRVYLSTIINIPNTYATTTALNEGLAGKADTAHTHTIANVTGLQDTLNTFRLKSQTIQWNEIAELGEVGVN